MGEAGECHETPRPRPAGVIAGRLVREWSVAAEA